MIRSALKARQQKTNDGAFRFRGIDNTRVEALSDGVFAIATALLVVSSDIPETFSELILFMQDFFPFAVCIVLLILIWHQHYLFFIRYGFKDAKIVSVNTLLLLLILFYIYPLKFLFTLLYDMFASIITGDNALHNRLFTNVIRIEVAPTLMLIYGIGAASIFLTLAWMYWIAYQRKEKLKLTPIETFDTRHSMHYNLVMGSVPIASSVVSQLPISPDWAFAFSGWTYWIYPVLMIPYANFKQRIRNKMLSK